MRERPVQLGLEHYAFETYDHRERWASYWHQIRATMSLVPRPRRVLEIGSGTAVYRSYLAGQGIAVQTADIDAARYPDYLTDVSDLDTGLPAGLRFDVVAAFQVLEHLPYAEFDRCLAAIARRADPWALISLPYYGWTVQLSARLAALRISVGGKIWKPRRFPPDRQHYWELGWQHTSRAITGQMLRHFDVVDRSFVPENPYHYLWVLRSRQASTPPKPA